MCFYPRALRLTGIELKIEGVFIWPGKTPMRVEHNFEKKEWRPILALILLIALVILVKNIVFYSTTDEYKQAKLAYLALSEEDRRYQQALYDYAQASHYEYLRALKNSSIVNYFSRTELYNNALSLYREAADAGNLDALTQLWEMVPSEAILKELERYASTRHKGANYALGQAYHHGLYAEQNYESAINHYLPAAMAGDPRAMLALYTLYQDIGLGATAYSWSLVYSAFSDGRIDSMTLPVLTDQELADAKAQAHTLINRIQNQLQRP
jgi:hypothetical protein